MRSANANQPAPLSPEYPDLLFLAAKSQDFVAKQIESYRHRHQNSATILTLLAVFLPFFLNGLDQAMMPIQVLSLVPTGLIIWAVLLFLSILRAQDLDHGFIHTKLAELINKPFEDILLYEISANSESFDTNSPINNLAGARYNRAIVLTVVAVICSALLLTANKFFVTPAEPQQVQLINPFFNGK